jgi:hypothetical protein
MKKILLAHLYMTLVSLPAFAETTIAVSCQCSFFVDTVQHTILVYAEATDASEFDVENCVLEDGKVVAGTCWYAKGQAMRVCEKEARELLPDQLSLPVVTIDEDACYGQVDKN